MTKSYRQATVAAGAFAVMLAATIAAGTAHGQRSGTASDLRTAVTYVKLPDGRLVRPASPVVQAKVDAVINAPLRISPGAGAVADLTAGRNACIAKCQGLADDGPVEAEQCEPKPGLGDGTVLGHDTPAGDKPCKSTKKVTIGAGMMVGLCEQMCAEKYQVPK